MMGRLKCIAIIITSSFLLVANMAEAQQIPNFKPAIFYGKSDMMINQSTFMFGIKPFMEETGINVMEKEPQFLATAKKSMIKLAEQGYNPILAVGSDYPKLITEVSTMFPKVSFVLIDAKVMRPNVKSVMFSEHEGSFAVGALAALMSKSHTVGFIGGQDNAMVRKFSCGFAQGLNYMDKNTKLIIDMAGTTKAGFKNPELGERIANTQVDSGADIIYQVAGHTHIGVFNAVERKNILGIGSVMNQNWMRPGKILTSMVKRVGPVTYQVLMEAMAGSVQTGMKSYGLAEGGVDWAVDNFNENIFSEEIKDTINKVKSDIINGSIQVHNYMSNKSCPI